MKANIVINIENTIIKTVAATKKDTVGRVYLPKEFIGKRVMVVVIEDE